ncbi:PAS domain-containing protein [Curvivirga aplysinae]|uniref:PAS domain-containing protein n=1 Tax=Curvivirga aplysinae TaxID=2529852 RepID=UPI001C3F9322|nr:PAS domain-containing protein [Curvivirga aplysinae]
MTTNLENLIDLTTLSGKLKNAYDYWLLKKSAGHLPHRKEIDPIEIIRILPNISLMQILRDNQSKIIDFRYDLIGGIVDSHTVSNRHHQKLSEIPHQNETTNIFKCLKTAAETHTALAVSMEYIGNDLRIDHAECLIMPLSGDTEDAESILTAVVFVEKT